MMIGVFLCADSDGSHMIVGVNASMQSWAKFPRL